MHFIPDEPTPQDAQQLDESTEEILPDLPDGVASLDAHRKDVLLDPLTELLFSGRLGRLDDGGDDDDFGPPPEGC
ncbi:hypothetical protein [Pyxidicoccus sp. MSG2]|uniref:hypothetical protein n=1 Tax=Pyxidicoccus sp. MSG2 TaxID=2996790 RepID=UPI00226EDD10|nr:hypothetical protein [Pyxidicoccus sp. MSG2]MCY1024051.1 hypothetical protein [Pyxidicoccus sp. MSG2]